MRRIGKIFQNLLSPPRLFHPMGESHTNLVFETVTSVIPISTWQQGGTSAASGCCSCSLLWSAVRLLPRTGCTCGLLLLPPPLFSLQPHPIMLLPSAMSPSLYKVTRCFYVCCQIQGSFLPFIHSTFNSLWWFLTFLSVNHLLWIYRRPHSPSSCPISLGTPACPWPGSFSSAAPLSTNGFLSGQRHEESIRISEKPLCFCSVNMSSFSASIFPRPLS